MGAQATVSQVLHWRAPIQQRSRKTLERILHASTRLLRDRPLADIAVGEITARANCSTGSFYQRFASKEDLLPALYEQYDQRLRQRLETMLSALPTTATSLTDVARTLVGAMVDQYVNERWLYREFALYTRARTDALTPDMAARRKQVHQLPVAHLSRYRDEIRHSNPEEAILFAIFLVGSAAREKVLFANAPHAAVTDVSQQALKDELTHAFVAYLTT